MTKTRAAIVLAATLGLAGVAPAEEVTFTTDDGVELHADLEVADEAADAPVAILLHQYRSDRSSWAPLTDDLLDLGINVLAVDQRGHGESTRQAGQELRVEAIPTEDFAEVVLQGPLDVQAALAFLEGRGLATRQVLLVGASYGCTVALLAAEEVDGLAAVVLLSPAAGYFGIDVRERIDAVGGPVLAFSAQEDRSFASAHNLLGREDQAGSRYFVEFEGAAHGTALLGDDGPSPLEHLCPDDEAEAFGRLDDDDTPPQAWLVWWLAEVMGWGG